MQVKIDKREIFPVFRLNIIKMDRFTLHLDGACNRVLVLHG